MKAECTAARAWLLEAELADLRANNGPHAEHIATCPRCTAAARTLLQGHADLDTALDELRVSKKPLSRRRGVWLWAPVPLAAAAALALLLTRGEPIPPPPSALLAQLMLPEAPLISPPAGKNAVVMETHDLTVVWLY